MRQASHLALVVLLMLPGFLGCSYKHLYGETMRGVDLGARHHAHVVRHAEDERRIDRMIGEELVQAGFRATVGPESADVPEGADLVVTYEDHWQWDMSMYLITLRIDFRDPQTQELLASGQSFRTSLDRKPPEFMVDEIITSMFAGR